MAEPFVELLISRLPSQTVLRAPVKRREFDSVWDGEGFDGSLKCETRILKSSHVNLQGEQKVIDSMECEGFATKCDVDLEK